MRWLPDQKHIVFGATDGQVQVLSLESNKISKVLIPHEKPILGLAVSNGNNLVASGGNDGVIRVWDTLDWSQRGVIQTFLGPVWALAFTADGRSLYYGSLDDEVKFWNITNEPNNDTRQGRKTRRFQVKTGATQGELQFARKCSVCHTLQGNDANRAGPGLHKLFGRKAGTVAGYRYSDSLLDSTIVWNENTLDELFARGPHEIVPGTKMPLQKVSNDEKRKALIQYLRIATN
jgi:cytochrome c